MSNTHSEYSAKERKEMQTSAPRRVGLVLVAWVSTLLLSKLPLVIARDFLGTDIPWINYAWIGLALALWVVTFVWQPLKPLRSYFLIMGVILLMSFGFDPLVKQSAIWNNLFVDRSPMVILFGERALLTLESLIVVMILLFSGMDRQQAFLTIGNLKAPLDGQNNSTDKRKLPWSIFGTAMAILLGGLFFWFLSSQNPTAKFDISTVLPLFPLILASAALNAISEEVTYRAAPLGTLFPVVGPTHALWLTSLWFGLGHYYGGIPSGPVGLVQTGLLALLLGKAMLDTRGLGWSWIIHVVLDTVIYVVIATTI
ncbi:MAG: CPBP family intramembrane metalloprotease [Anaerolineales bacterium]|nr:CPBP family intramembrane metalloprotease [Anaerolineales bacterium]